jgi:hypothetical protein
MGKALSDQHSFTRNDPHPATVAVKDLALANHQIH